MSEEHFEVKQLHVTQAILEVLKDVLFVILQMLHTASVQFSDMILIIGLECFTCPWSASSGCRTAMDTL